MPNFGEELKSRFEQIDSFNQTIGRQNQDHTDLIVSGKVRTEAMRKRVTAHLTARQTEVFTQLLETAAGAYEDLAGQELAVGEVQASAMAEIIDRYAAIDAREAEAAETIEHDRQLILEYLPELSEELEELSSSLQQDTSSSEREELNAKRAELEKQIKTRDPIVSLAEKPWPVPQLITPADFMVAATGKGTEKRRGEQRTRVDNYVDYFTTVASQLDESDAELLKERVFLLDVEPDKYSERDMTWFRQHCSIDLNPRSSSGVSVTRRLGEQGIVLQQGIRNLYDESGKQHTKPHSVWRSIYVKDYDPAVHEQAVEVPGKKIDWKPVENVAVAKKEDKPGQDRDELSRELRADVDREIRIKLTAYFRQHEDQILTMEGIAEDLIDSTTRSILEVQSIEHGEQSHAYTRNRIRRHLSAEQGELLCDSLAKADRVLQYGWQQVKVKDSLDRNQTKARRVVRPVSKGRLTWQHFDASELEGCRVDWEVTEEQRALADTNEAAAAAKLANPTPPPTPPGETGAKPESEALEALKVRMKAETVKALNDFENAGLVGGAKSGDDRPAVKLGERLMITGEAGPKIKGLMTALRVARLSKHDEHSVTVRDLVRMRLSQTHSDEILGDYPGHGDVIHATDCAITEFFAERKEQERAARQQARQGSRPTQPWQPAPPRRRR